MNDLESSAWNEVHAIVEQIPHGKNSGWRIHSNPVGVGYRLEKISTRTGRVLKTYDAPRSPRLARSPYYWLGVVEAVLRHQTKEKAKDGLKKGVYTGTCI